MDTHVKEGQLYVQHQKFGKKWKKNWFVLYPASQNGIARLEFFDSHTGGSGSSGGSVSASNEKTKKLDKKIIRLSECISILPALTENCPKENMAAFCVETVEKTHVFAAERSAAREWMETMCDIAFQGGSGTGAATDSNEGPKDLQMSENLIYYSREEVNEFWVTVQRNEASERCGLTGNYWLKAESDVLILKEAKTKRKVLVWPYKLLRRYGRDRVMFSFEAGRRCDSGPGTFTFETKQGNEIFTLVDQAIQSQKALAEEHHLSGPPSLDLDCPPSLQHIRNPPFGSGDSSGSGSSCSSSREADGDSGGSKPGSADGVLGKRDGGDGGRGQASGAALKGRSLPEPPPVLGGGNTPLRTKGGKKGVAVEEKPALYSEPADSVRIPLHSADGLYSDPVDSIKSQSRAGTPCSPPLPTPRQRDDPAGSGGADQPFGRCNHRTPPDLYSHVYDQINALNLNGDGGGGGEGGRRGKKPRAGQVEGSSQPPAGSSDHIYDEPEGCAKGVGLLLSMYEEARLEPHNPRRQEDSSNSSGPDGNSAPTLKSVKQSDPQRHSPLPPASGRSAPQLPMPKGPKPLTAPKPAKGIFARKDLVPPPPAGKHAGVGNNMNNNNNMWPVGKPGKELYGKVSKQKPAHLWDSQNQQAPLLRSPDIIYDNLGDI